MDLQLFVERTNRPVSSSSTNLPGWRGHSRTCRKDCRSCRKTDTVRVYLLWQNVCRFCFRHCEAWKLNPKQPPTLPSPGPTLGISASLCRKRKSSRLMFGSWVPHVASPPTQALLDYILSTLRPILERPAACSVGFGGTVLASCTL